MPGLSIHVVDVARGVPAVGLAVEVWRLAPVRTSLASGHVGESGAAQLGALDTHRLEPGRYEAVFHVGDYYRETNVTLPEHPFIDEIPFVFGIDDPDQHCRLPLKITPWGFSLFRGAA